MSDQAQPPKAQIIHAPSTEVQRAGTKSIFLAGTTTSISSSSPEQEQEQDWRTVLTSRLSHHANLTIFNPHRPDWSIAIPPGSESPSFPPFNEQVTWELSKQETCDLIVVYFHPSTLAPISLLEFGLAAASARGEPEEKKKKKVVVAVAPRDYAKRANVQMVCLRYGCVFLEDVKDVPGVVEMKLGLSLE